MRQISSTLFLSRFQPYLTVLAFVDTFLIIMFLLDNVLIGHISMSSEDWFYTVVPYLTHPLKKISITMSMLWVVVIAMKRFQAVTKPLKDNSEDSFCVDVIFLIIFAVSANLSK